MLSTGTAPAVVRKESTRGRSEPGAFKARHICWFSVALALADGSAVMKCEKR